MSLEEAVVPGPAATLQAIRKIQAQWMVLDHEAANFPVLVVVETNDSEAECPDKHSVPGESLSGHADSADVDASPEDTEDSR